MKYLLDTNMLIYWTKGLPSVVQNVIEHGSRSICASALSRAELYYGAYRSVHVERNLRAIKRLSEEIKFISVNEDIERLFGQNKTALRKSGNLIEDFDIMIAATAIAHNCILVTNNESHFKRIPNLQIENWWIE